VIQAIIAFLTALPELIKLVNNLQVKNKQAANRQKVKDDIKKINEAFDNQDSDALNRVFNNTSLRDKS
jgi:hypothetical protein